ncbi:MAG TPA: hypothetical protein VND64_23725 [Pirellulales bacterium]|nr:hypothetical protein [Pirellulales bacterium]
MRSSSWHIWSRVAVHIRIAEAQAGSQSAMRRRGSSGRLAVSRRSARGGYSPAGTSRPVGYYMKSENVPPRPVIGASATKLGVREGDLAPDEDGNARPGQGGMSVVSSISGLRRRVARNVFSPSMVPQRLNDLGKVPGAMGPNTLHVFRIGEGGFEHARLTDRLVLAPDHDDHGTIQPASMMRYEEYKQAITDTRDQWASGEDDDDR